MGKKLLKRALCHIMVLMNFSTDSYSLECCLDYELTDNSFLLVFDEAPDFSGEPEPLPEECGEEEKTYFYKKIA